MHIIIYLFYEHITPSIKEEMKINKTHGPSFQKSDFIIYKEMHMEMQSVSCIRNKMNKWGKEEMLIRKGRFSDS